MKNYTITVNGNVYDVVVEEGASTGAPAAAPQSSTEGGSPRQLPLQHPKAAAPAGAAGSVKI